MDLVSPKDSLITPMDSQYYNSNRLKDFDEETYLNSDNVVFDDLESHVTMYKDDINLANYQTNWNKDKPKPN